MGGHLSALKRKIDTLKIELNSLNSALEGQATTDAFRILPHVLADLTHLIAMLDEEEENKIVVDE